MQQFFLTDKNIVITGASSGIGRQTAIDCSHAGATVVLVGRSYEKLIQTRGLMTSPDKHTILIADFSDERTVEHAIKTGLDNIKIHGIVHSAGVSTTLPFRSITDQKLHEFFQVNVFSSLALTRLLTKPGFLDQRGASIVFIASVMGVVGESAKTLYSATKGALISASRSMAVELADKNVRINCISPGVVVTPMTDSAVYSQDTEARKKIESLHPLGIGVPQDISNACIYLLSDASRWITGTNLIIDGGYTAK